MDSRSTVYDDVLFVSPALRAVTFSSTLPLLDDNQEAAENAFLIELARANADDTAYLHPLPSKGVRETHSLVSLNQMVRHKSVSRMM